jgi:aspartate carbamoyltransferase regulatory subunit
MEKTLSVSAIENGTVIDHIPPGCAVTIIHLLKLQGHPNQVTVGLNLKSRRLGLKDLIKIENRFLSEKEAHDIAVFAPLATLSLIRDFQVEKKIQAELPKIIEKILACPNPRCVTRHEPIPSAFSVEEFRGKVSLRCTYCEKRFAREEVR